MCWTKLVAATAKCPTELFQHWFYSLDLQPFFIAEGWRQRVKRELGEGNPVLALECSHVFCLSQGWILHQWISRAVLYLPGWNVRQGRRPCAADHSWHGGWSWCNSMQRHLHTRSTSRVLFTIRNSFRAIIWKGGARKADEQILIGHKEQGYCAAVSVHIKTT